MSEHLLVSKRQAAAMLGLSVRTLENLISLKELPVRRVGRRCLVERQALEKFAKRDHATRPQPSGTGPCKPFDPHSWHDHKTKLERKGNDNAGESPSIQTQS